MLKPSERFKHYDFITGCEFSGVYQFKEGLIHAVSLLGGYCNLRLVYSSF
jgi:hypothetical protein